MEIWLISGLVAFTILVLVLVMMRFASSRAAAAYDSNLDLDDHGILRGGGLISHSGPRGAPGLLLLHGLTATPQEMAFLAQGLHEKGYRVLAPIIDGHARTTRELARSGWIDWAESCRQAYQELADEGRQVAIIGISAGAILACRVAELEKPAALICLAPLVGIRGALANQVGWLRFLRPFIGKKPEQRTDPSTGSTVTLEAFDIFDQEAVEERVAHLFIPTRAVAQSQLLLKTTWKSLPRIEVPALVIGSEHDGTIVTEGPRTLSRALTGCEPCEYGEVKESGHVISVDRDREEVLTRVVEFLQEHCPPEPEQHDGLVVDSRTIQAGD